jgi:hypothetical protein
MIELIALAFLICTLIIIMYTKEGFSSKREKAKRIHDWFSGNSNHSYTSYRGAMDRKSNIVEYEDVKKLFDKKDFTVSSIEAVI